jgi:hypothetical protein
MDLQAACCAPVIKFSGTKSESFSKPDLPIYLIIHGVKQSSPGWFGFSTSFIPWPSWMKVTSVMFEARTSPPVALALSEFALRPA